jgi:primosomal protein N'
MSLKQEYVNTNALKFGPFKEGVYKINGLFRQKLVIKYRECAEIRELFSKLMTQFLALGLSDVKLEADINPCTV